MNLRPDILLLFFSFLSERSIFLFMTMISPLDSICRKVTAEIILSVSGEISLRDGTNPTFLHLEIHTTTSQTIYIFINLHIFHSIRTCEGEGGSKDPFNQKILNACNFFAQFRNLQDIFFGLTLSLSFLLVIVVTSLDIMDKGGGRG